MRLSRGVLISLFMVGSIAAQAALQNVTLHRSDGNSLTTDAISSYFSVNLAGAGNFLGAGKGNGFFSLPMMTAGVAAKPGYVFSDLNDMNGTASIDQGHITVSMTSYDASTCATDGNVIVTLSASGDAPVGPDTSTGLLILPGPNPSCTSFSPGSANKVTPGATNFQNFSVNTTAYFPIYGAHLYYNGQFYAYTSYDDTVYCVSISRTSTSCTVSFN